MDTSDLVHNAGRSRPEPTRRPDPTVGHLLRRRHRPPAARPGMRAVSCRLICTEVQRRLGGGVTSGLACIGWSRDRLCVSGLADDHGCDPPTAHRVAVRAAGPTRPTRAPAHGGIEPKRLCATSYACDRLCVNNTGPEQRKRLGRDQVCVGNRIDGNWASGCRRVGRSGLSGRCHGGAAETKVPPRSRKLPGAWTAPT